MFDPSYPGALNGDYAYPDMDLDDDYQDQRSTSRRKKDKPFIPNRLYYHVELFNGEEHEVVHETKKATLFEVCYKRNGTHYQFWVPKRLLKERDGKLFIHQSFKRTYIPIEKENEYGTNE